MQITRTEVSVTLCSPVKIVLWKRSNSTRAVCGPCSNVGTPYPFFNGVEIYRGCWLVCLWGRDLMRVVDPLNKENPDFHNKRSVVSGLLRKGIVRYSVLLPRKTVLPAELCHFAIWPGIRSWPWPWYASGCNADLVRSSRMWIITDGLASRPIWAIFWSTTVCRQSDPRVLVPIEKLVGWLVVIEPLPLSCMME